MKNPWDQGIFHEAVETHSTLGDGELPPPGDLHRIASIGLLNGILLMAWFGIFLFAVVQHAMVQRANDLEKSVGSGRS